MARAADRHVGGVLEEELRRAGVAAEHRPALARLCREWPFPARGRAGGGGDGAAAAVGPAVEDYGHWRLFERSRTGDGEAAARFEAHWRDAARAFLGRGFTREQAEELASLFFERVYARAHAFAWATPFAVYLRTVLLNLARDEVRRLRRSRAREEALEDDAEAERLPDPGPSAEERLLREERARALERALARLPPADRELLVASVRDGLGGDALAARLGIGRDALYQRLSRARRRLRALVDGQLSGR